MWLSGPLLQEPGGYGRQYHTCDHEARSICSGRRRQKSAVRRRTWGNGRKVIYQPLLLPISIPNDGFAAWEVDTSRVLGCAGPLRSSCRRRISALHGALHTHLEVDVTLRFRRAGCVGYRCRAGSEWPATWGRSSKALPVSEVQAREGRRRTAGVTHRGM